MNISALPSTIVRGATRNSPLRAIAVIPQGGGKGKILQVIQMKNTGKIKIFVVALFVFFIVFTIFTEDLLTSRPLYMARAPSRSCQTCHDRDNLYKNEKYESGYSIGPKKRTFSCRSCHVNPGGSGLRTVAGRFYARNKLPMIDWNLWGFDKTKPGDKSKPGDETKPDDESKPDDEYHNPTPPKFFYPFDVFAFGQPLDAPTSKEQNPYAFDRERYPYLNADPLLLIGSDIRVMAPLVRDKEASFFPMQVELGAAIHPVEYLTFNIIGGLQGKRSGFDESTKRIKLQNAFLLIHELPKMMSVQVGLFRPSFGIRFEDHSTPGRRMFEMSPSKEKNLVLGAEFAISPHDEKIGNDFYSTVTVFTNRTVRDPYSFTGLGGALTAGWRLWSYGGGISVLFKERGIEDRGRLAGAGINGYYSLGDFDLPLVFQAELNIGQHQETYDELMYFMTSIIRADYLIVQGINLLTSYNFFLEDLTSPVRPIEEHRLAVGFEFTIVYGARLTSEYRWTFSKRNDINSPSRNSTVSEFFFYLYTYL